MRSRLVAGLAILLLYTLVQHIAVVMIAPGFPPLTVRPLSLSEHMLSLMLCWVPLVFLDMRPRTAGPCAAWILYIFAYFSSAAIAPYSLCNTTDYVTFMIFLLGCLGIFCATSRFHFSATSFAGSLGRLDVALLLVLAGAVLLAWHKCGYRFSVDIADIYDRRMEARAFHGTAEAYVIGILRLVLPILMVHYVISKKSLPFLVFGAAALVVIFSLDGTKSTFLYPLLFAFCTWVLLKDRFVPSLLFLLCTVSGLAVAEYYLIDSSYIIGDLIIRRVFIVPGMVAGFYYDHIEVASKTVQLQGITFEIGRLYLGNPDCNANTNLWMWGLAWADFLGGFAVAGVSGLLVSIFNTCPGSRFGVLGVVMAMGCSLTWAEQFLHTSMLSSGVFYVLVLAVLAKISPGSFPSWFVCSHSFRDPPTEVIEKLAHPTGNQP